MPYRIWAYRWFCFGLWLFLGGGLGLSARSELGADEKAPMITSSPTYRMPEQVGGTLIIPLPGDPKTFQPLASYDAVTMSVTYGFIFEGLLQVNALTQELTPGLARSWSISPDGLTWIFHLQPDLFWSDGQPLTADDVVFSFDQMMQPTSQSPLRSLFLIRDKPVRIRASAADTVIFELPSPYSPFLSVVGTFVIIPRHHFPESKDASEFARRWGVNTPPDQIVGSGPFCLAAYKPGEKIVLERNSHYWKKDGKGRRLPYLDRIILLIQSNQDTRLLKFLSGEADILPHVRPQDVDLLEKDAANKNYLLYNLGPDVNINFFWFNLNTTENPKTHQPLVAPYKSVWFRDRRFRQAMAYATNRAGMVKAILQGRGSPLQSLKTETDKIWAAHNLPEYPYDLAKAGALLKEIGFSDRNGDTWLEDGAGHPLEFDLITTSQNRERELAGTIIKHSLAKIGVKVNLASVDYNLLIQKIYSTFDYEAIVLGLQSGVPLDPALWRDIFLSSGRYHLWFPQQVRPGFPWETEIDQLVERDLILTDIPKRQENFAKILRILATEQPLIYTYVPHVFMAAKKNLVNFRPSVLDPRGTWNIEWLFWESGAPAAAPK